MKLKPAFQSTFYILLMLCFELNAHAMSPKRLSVDPSSLYGRAETRNLADRKDRRQAPFSSIGELVMKFRWGSQSSCTGTVLDDTHVLTAAHCVVDERNNNDIAIKIKFMPARWGALRTYVASSVKRVYLSKNYFNGYPTKDDFAILELKHRTRAPSIDLKNLSEISDLNHSKVCAIGYPNTERTDLFGDIVENNNYAWSSCGDHKDLIEDEGDLTLGNLLIISNGMSGGPVVVQESNGQWALMSVISRVGYDRVTGRFMRNEGVKITTSTIERIKGWMAGKFDSTDFVKDL